MAWFSGMCRRLCIVEGKGAIAKELSVYVFRATTRRTAVARLLEMARRQDKQFVNGYGERTRWVVISVETVDELTDGRLSDMEVFSEITDFIPADSTVSFDAVFTPDVTSLGWSGVPGDAIPEPRFKSQSGRTSPARKPRRR
jgi:hypothetical protein